MEAPKFNCPNATLRGSMSQNPIHTCFQISSNPRDNPVGKESRNLDIIRALLLNASNTLRQVTSPPACLSFLICKREVASLFKPQDLVRQQMCLCFTFQLKSSELRLILVLSIRSLYPLRSGSFLSCSVSSDHQWRVHICCELDDSWVCI